MTDIRVTYSVSGADLRRHYTVYRAIEALIELVSKIAWFEQGYAEGFAAGQEAMRCKMENPITVDLKPIPHHRAIDAELEESEG